MLLFALTVGVVICIEGKKCCCLYQWQLLIFASMVVSNSILSTAVDLFVFTVSAVNCWGFICDGINNFSFVNNSNAMV